VQPPPPDFLLALRRHPLLTCPPRYGRTRPDDNGSDMWALGCLLFELAMLAPPSLANVQHERPEPQGQDGAGAAASPSTTRRTLRTSSRACSVRAPARTPAAPAPHTSDPPPQAKTRGADPTRARRRTRGPVQVRAG